MGVDRVLIIMMIKITQQKQKKKGENPQILPLSRVKN